MDNKTETPESTQEPVYDDFFGDQEGGAINTNLKIDPDFNPDTDDPFDALVGLYEESVKPAVPPKGETKKAERIIPESERIVEEARLKKIAKRKKKKNNSKLAQIKKTVKKKPVYDDPFDAPIDQAQAIADKYDDWM